MSFKEINDLRKSGKLKEALEMTTAALNIDPNDIWIKRAASWVYYAYIKANCNTDSFDNFVDYLQKIKELELDKDEAMLFDNCGWQVGSLVFSLLKENPVDYKKLNTIFDIIKHFHFTIPSDAYTFIYKAFHQGSAGWTRYLEFADWWNFDNFGTNDFIEEEINRRKMPSIAEKAFIAYSKKLLEGVSGEYDENQQLINKSKIDSFLPKLEKLTSEHPHFTYLSYYMAKLLLVSGSQQDALSAFMPFAKIKRNDFWVWQLFTEIFSDDKEMQLACYCKALSLKTPEDYLVKLRQSFAELLVEMSLYVEAKTEIEILVATREKNGWNIPNQVNYWKRQVWYDSVITKGNNRVFYTMHAKRAEELFYRDTPEEIIVVEFVNSGKKILNFVKDKQKSGFFKYSGLIEKPKIGDLIKVRFNGSGDNGFYKILTAEHCPSTITSEAMKEFSGTFKSSYRNDFGFTDNVFIDSKLAREHSLQDGQSIQGKAVISFNKKKGEWGWKALTVE